MSLARELRFLVVDAYPEEGRTALLGAGGTEAGRLYERMLLRIEPEATVDSVYAADADALLPKGISLEQYDGVAWTGSSLTIYALEDARVRRQVELARAVYAAHVPSFGSCWAAQISVVAAGGTCAANPRGREFGVARAITLSPEGRSHALYRGKPSVFEAFSSHADEVVDLPPGGAVLASNRFSRVQALSVSLDGGSFWALQYHPEYDLHEVASLCRLRANELVRQGTFADHSAAEIYTEQLEKLHRDPAREDIARELGVGPDVLDEERRTLEVRNWIEFEVKPRARQRS